jgi:hypothetical protein
MRTVLEAAKSWHRPLMLMALAMAALGLLAGFAAVTVAALASVVASARRTVPAVAAGRFERLGV